MFDDHNQATARGVYLLAPLARSLGASALLASLPLLLAAGAGSQRTRQRTRSPGPERWAGLVSLRVPRFCVFNGTQKGKPQYP